MRVHDACFTSGAAYYDACFPTCAVACFQQLKIALHLCPRLPVVTLELTVACDPKQSQEQHCEHVVVALQRLFQRGQHWLTIS